MKKYSIVLLVLFVIFSLCSCSLNLNPTDFMRPPKASGSEAKIEELIKENTDGDYTLVYPKTGSNKSSVTYCNIDNGFSKVVACFKTLKDSKNHILFISINDNDYKVVDCQTLPVGDIDRIEFCDLDGDTKKELLVGIGDGTSTKNALHIYKFTDDYVVSYDTPCEYSSMVTGDFNKDSKSDLLLFCVSSLESPAKAKLVTFSDNTITELTSCELDSSITKYISVSYCRLNDKIFGAVADGINSDGELLTQIIYVNKNSALENPMFIYSGYGSTKRLDSILSKDIDNDECIEIPVFPNKEEKESIKNILWSGYDFDNMSLYTKKNAMYVADEGYMIIIPERLIGAVTAQYDENNRETTLYAYEYVGDTQKATYELLKIKTFSKSDFESSTTGYAEIATLGANVYAYSVPDDENYLSISGDEVTKGFSLVTK